MKTVVTDGGRAAAGFRGRAGDCAVRAIAIATQRPYIEVYTLVNMFCANEKQSKRKRGVSTARTGIHKDVMQEVMKHIGWVWVPTMQFGSGCTTHLRAEELPAGRIIVNLSRHYAAVIDGVLHDGGDCSRGGSRCVYGYWKEA